MVDESRIPHLLAALDGLRTRVSHGLRHRAETAGVTIRGSEGRVLFLIATDGTRPIDLADGAWITRQAISKRLKEMAERGLVTIEPDPSDRRAQLVRRTTAGDQLRSFATEQIADLEQELAESVGWDRYRVFREVAHELAIDFVPRLPEKPN